MGKRGPEKQTAELPDWYSLDNYYGNDDSNKGIRNFTLVEWYVQIKRRLKAIAENNSEKKKEKLLAIFENPIKNIPELEPKIRPWNYSGVRVASHRDYSVLNRLKERCKPFKPSGLKKDIQSMPLIKRLDQAEFYKYDLEKLLKGRAILSVDLNLSTSTLIKGLREIINQLRESDEFKDVKAQSVKDYDKAMKKWCDLSVLPYWDLSKWAEIEGKNIPNGQFADVLDIKTDQTEVNFDEDKVRLTIDSNVKNIFNQGHLETMEALILKN